MQEVAIALDTLVGKLNPLRLATSLLEEVNGAVVVCDVN